MKLTVAKELKLPGTIGEAEWTEQGEALEESTGVRFAKPVAVRARFVFDGDGFGVEGEIKTTFLSQCARCSKEFEEPFEAGFDERFERGAGPDDEIYPFTGDELDMSDLVRDAILLNKANFSLCKPDCRGLCPVCGQDLNTSQCGCKSGENEQKSPFAALEALLKDDKEV